MLAKDLIKKIRRIEIRTSQLVNSALAGQYHSAFRGLGMEFEEVRQYQMGDDVRTIDWNVSARFGEPYVKVFREERELTVMLVVDLSRSQEFGTAGQLKRELVTELCATLAFSAIKNNDKVGLIGFTDRVEIFVPPRKGTRHVLRVIRELLTFEVTGHGTSIQTAVDHLNRTTRRRAVVFVVSDFQDTDYERSLRIANRRHDVILIEVGDERELEFPAVGLIELEDRETGQRVVVDAGSRRWRKTFAELARDRREQRDQAWRRLKLDCINVRTSEPFVEPLTSFFRARERRQSR